MIRIATAILTLLWLTLVAGCMTAMPAQPQLRFDESVATDFQILADETWAQFLSTFAARSTCFGDVTLRTDRNLDSRALYDPQTSTVTVQVPRTPAFLKAALVHEWAHHVEFQCDAHHSLRPRIIAALGLPVDSPWRTAIEWADTPAEHYAEAVVELVLGDHPLPTKILVNPQIVAEIDAWLQAE